MIQVKWVHVDNMTDNQVCYANGDPMGKQVPVIPLSALTEMMKELECTLKGADKWGGTRSPYAVGYISALCHLLDQLAGHMKGGAQHE